MIKEKVAEKRRDDEWLYSYGLKERRTGKTGSGDTDLSVLSKVMDGEGFPDAAGAYMGEVLEEVEGDTIRV